jgi:predicted DNA-binding ArsR family transcriptional regulator
MRSYTAPTSKIILKRIIEILADSDVEIDDTITVQKTDLSDILEDLRISNFDFNCVAKLKKTLSFEGYKIIYKDSKVVKVKKEEEMAIGEIPLKYC